MQPLGARSSPAQGPLDEALRVPQGARAVAPGLGEGRVSFACPQLSAQSLGQGLAQSGNRYE